MTEKRNQGRRQVCLEFGLKASMLLLLGSFVSGCSTSEQYGSSDTALAAPVQVALVTPEPPPPDLPFLFYATDWPQPPEDLPGTSNSSEERHRDDDFEVFVA